MLLPGGRGSNTRGQERPTAARVAKIREMGRTVFVVDVIVIVVGDGVTVIVIVAVVIVVIDGRDGSSVCEWRLHCAYPRLFVVSSSTKRKMCVGGVFVD